jgi:hypothetical protein
MCDFSISDLEHSTLFRKAREKIDLSPLDSRNSESDPAKFPTSPIDPTRVSVVGDHMTGMSPKNG